MGLGDREGQEGRVGHDLLGAGSDIARRSGHEAFKAKYGIEVKVNRQVDSVMVQQITAEQGSGKPVADLWVQASKNYTLGAVKNKWVTAPIGPDFYAKAYNRKTLLGPGPTAIVAAAVLGMAWNTSLYPAGIKDIPDFLDSKLTGKIGVPQPTSASFIDWYLWLEETYGKNILTSWRHRSRRSTSRR